MSKFLSKRLFALSPYVPGEQPKEKKYIKLNTNESPFPPSPLAAMLARQAAGDNQLYSDPDLKELTLAAQDAFGVSADEVIFTNGSDEILNFAFMAFCENETVFPDVTYGFYPVFAALNGVKYTEIPLKEDFTIDINDYIGINKNIFLANPNAQTGIALTRDEIEKIVASNPNNIVVIDEAYVDFGAQSCVPLIKKYDNLLVTQTFSKSRSLAGARLGMGFACKALIADLNTIRFSTNPYNVNRMTSAAGVGAMRDEKYFKKNCAAIIATRENTVKALNELGFSVLPSSANFVLAKSHKIGGEALYQALKREGILVRHFSTKRLCEYNRITIGSDEEMNTLICTIKKILEEEA